MTIIVKAARTKVDIKYDLYFQPVMTGDTAISVFIVFSFSAAVSTGNPVLVTLTDLKPCTGFTFSMHSHGVTLRSR